MKLSLPILIILSIFFSLTIFAQVGKVEQYSNAKTALIIDSLEQVISNSPEIVNRDVLYQLAHLYQHIDQDQAKMFAHQFIFTSDSLTSAIKLNSIYGLLANIHESQKKQDSSYYYLTLQSGLSDDSRLENNDAIKQKYLGNYNGNNRENEIIGFSTINFFIILILIILILIIVAYYSVSKKKNAQREAVKNKELELANTKLQQFSDELQQEIMANTIDRAIELEETSNVIVKLRKSLKKAEESNYLKNAFLGTMSHQIRTPLCGIMGFSDMLETELALRGNEDLYEFAKNIKEAGEKLMSLITNIIDISSIEANILELNIVSCDLNDIVRSVEKEYVFKAKEKGLIFKTKFDKDIPAIYADKDNLVKVLKVVMDNAIQYTSKGFVTISTNYNSKKNTATIEVKDKGISIDTETMKMLIESFDYSKHGSSLTYQGSGLGLILAHRLITLMNGSLELVSEKEIGTEVGITLPCLLAEGQIDGDKNTLENATIINAPEYGRLKIFIVEDDRMNRMVLEKMLKKTGEITTAFDGDDALKKLKKTSSSGNYYDVMLFDINLPAPWDGMKLMREIRKRFPHTNNTPFIAQTAYAMSGDKDLYLDAGFNDYISKPINKTELITMIQKQLELFKNR